MSDAAAPVLPAITEENAPYWEGARRGELLVQRCPATQRLLFPPRLRSPWAPTANDPLEWVRVSGRGEIWSFAVPHPPLLPWFAERAPYAVILVAREEDPRVRLVGNRVARAGAGFARVDPASVAIGAPVAVVFERVDDAVTLPQWVLR